MKTAGNGIDKVTADVREQPNKADLQRSIKRFAELNKKTQELVPRMRETVPKLKGDAVKRYQEAQDEYAKKVDLLGAKITEVQKRLDVLKTK